MTTQATRQASGVPGHRSVTGRSGALHRLWRNRWPYLFIAPFFVLFAVFFLYPIGFSLWLSFREWSGLGEAEYVGFDNYLRVFSDELFWNSMRNAVILFVIYVPVMTFLAIVYAAILSEGFVRLQGMWRGLIFLPFVTNMVAAGFTFQLVFSTRSGIVNQWLSVLGVSPVPWLDEQMWARITLGLLMIWAWVGYNTIIMLAGIQAIPPEIREAARVDGAGPIQRFFRVTVPLLRPVIIFSVTLSVIGTFNMFTEPFILTDGGPIRATETPVMQIFANTFEAIRFGYAAALSWVFLVIIIAITLIQFRFTTRGER
jgi:ABC-type sugar transport system permease subunit